jgi:hypothetical protein
MPTTATLQKSLMLGVAGVILVNLLKKGTSLGRLNFYPAAVSKITFDGAIPVMKFGLAAQNTSGNKFIVNSIAGNLYANGYLIGNISNFTPVVIPPNSQVIVPLTARLSPVGIVQNIIEAFDGGNFSIEVELDANANIDNFQAPINLKYKIGR